MTESAATGRFGIPDGGGWYEVEFAHLGPALVEEAFGWVEAWRDGASAVRPNQPPPCPDFAPDVTYLTGLEGARRVACFGSEPLELVGTLVERDTSGALFGGDPAWLANEPTYGVAHDPGPAAEGGLVGAHFPPYFEQQSLVGRIVRVTGHFDHAVAQECARRRLDGAVALDPAPSQSVEWCRQRFVVDSIQAVGE